MVGGITVIPGVDGIYEAPISSLVALLNPGAVSYRKMIWPDALAPLSAFSVERADRSFLVSCSIMIGFVMFPFDCPEAEILIACSTTGLSCMYIEKSDL